MKVLGVAVLLAVMVVGCAQASHIQALICTPAMAYEIGGINYPSPGPLYYASIQHEREAQQTRDDFFHHRFGSPTRIATHQNCVSHDPAEVYEAAAMSDTSGVSINFLVEVWENEEVMSRICTAGSLRVDLFRGLYAYFTQDVISLYCGEMNQVRVDLEMGGRFSCEHAPSQAETCRQFRRLFNKMTRGFFWERVAAALLTQSAAARF